ncbi:zinc ribbon domain-containing protein [Candidatus Enterovibrio escicola]|uniref:zinc ribbon domain-containing protein n=3 Tax=Candidatus Enterovibrio escicola TaxID=1927127 RepID=UPI001237AE9B
MRDWKCPNCGIQHDRDINAALNIQHQGIIEIKAAGHVVTACGSLRKSRHERVAA